MNAQKNILCVDDNTDTCELLNFIFEKNGFKVKTCDSPEEAVRYARNNHFAAIVVDFHLFEMDGVDLCRIIQTFDSNTPVIFYSAEAREIKKQEAFEAGAKAYLIKPNDFEQLVPTVNHFINESIKEPTHITSFQH
ncbi:MAG: response regulator [Acidobacteriota bacterium]|nr:response regulator [Acidobacteriota bacterium]